MASKAAAWMTRFRDVKAEFERVRTEEAPTYEGPGSVVTIWNEGALLLQAQISDPAAATALGRWLIDTFGEPDAPKETP